jgi:MFS family permease
VLATFQMAQDFGAIIGPILIGVVADMWGFGAAFALTGVISLAILPWLSARETLPSAEAAVGTRSP